MGGEIQGGVKCYFCVLRCDRGVATGGIVIFLNLVENHMILNFFNFTFYCRESMLIVTVGQHLTDPQQWKVIFQSILGRYHQQTVANSHYYLVLAFISIYQKEQQAEGCHLELLV